MYIIIIKLQCVHSVSWQPVSCWCRLVLHTVDTKHINNQRQVFQLCVCHMLYTKKSYKCICRSSVYRQFRSEKYSVRCVRNVTTGITGLWQSSVHSDVASSQFDVGSSYHWDTAVPKCRIVHQSIVHVSWVSIVVRQVGFTLLIVGNCEAGASP